MTEALKDTFNVRVTVTVLIPQFNQARVKDDSGRQYAVTRRTTGVDYWDLKEGDKLDCEITKSLPRVLHATKLP